VKYRDVFRLSCTEMFLCPPNHFFIHQQCFLLWTGAEEPFCGIELWLLPAALDMKGRT